MGVTVALEFILGVYIFQAERQLDVGLGSARAAKGTADMLSEFEFLLLHVVCAEVAEIVVAALARQNVVKVA